MRTFSKFLPLVAATLFAFVGSASAQLQTYETQSAYSGGNLVALNQNGPLSQTFTNVSAVKAMTYNLFATGPGATSGNATFTATFGQWNGSGLVGGTTVSFATINVPASSDPSWSSFTNGNGTFASYALSFDLASLAGNYGSFVVDATYGYLTSSASTYALMLTQTSSSTLSLGFITDPVPFPYGTTNFGVFDYVFSQIIVAPGSQQLVPVPESSTVASVVVGVMVFGLVGYRINQRRRSEVAPVLAG
jgi:hypothetical protein